MQDAGAAPCVERGTLSLAICKPMMRSSAEVDDLIFWLCGEFARSAKSPNLRGAYHEDAVNITKAINSLRATTVSTRPNWGDMLGAGMQNFMTSHQT